MPKKSLVQQANQGKLIAWYKWEFLRRNCDYRNDYKSFMGEFGSWFCQHGFWYDQTMVWDRTEFRFFAEFIAPKAKVICESWQIRDPISPDWNFAKSGSCFYNIESEILLPTTFGAT